MENVLAVVKVRHAGNDVVDDGTAEHPVKIERRVGQKFFKGPFSAVLSHDGETTFGANAHKANQIIVRGFSHLGDWGGGHELPFSVCYLLWYNLQL